ncbi:MAG: TFIIB-type zinc finger domain-containing protein [Oscillospiraceae bacterium]|nr:TFIIB-type zinc finger domain-containing protein [Oscillospiraceae bacterium]
MKKLECESCGSNDLIVENGYRVCRYCGTKHLIQPDEQPQSTATISLDSDVAALLQKCREDPARAARYAQLILEIDPGNAEAHRYLAVQQSQSSGGCYIATAVYGSYDCPEVWTLRRFRDGALAARWYGRAFVRLYYALSPTLVRLFGHSRWFRALWRPRLDRLVAKLRREGTPDGPYTDRPW